MLHLQGLKSSIQDCMYKDVFSLQRLVITYKPFFYYLIQGLSHQLKALIIKTKC